MQHKNKQIRILAAMDRMLALVFALLLTPLWIMNSLISISLLRHPIVQHKRRDALGRTVIVHNFKDGICRTTLRVIDVLMGRLCFVGLSTQHRLDKHDRSLQLPSGVVSLYDIYSTIGMNDTSHLELALKQQNEMSFKNHIKLMLKGGLNHFVYGRAPARCPRIFKIFGIRIDNLTMKEAVEWTLKRSKETKIAFFVNVNSVNIATNNADFKKALTKADHIFADGSGVRIAARHAGFNLKDNVNGTDLLPHLCRQSVHKHASIYLLGAEPGVANDAAKKLRETYPGLKIAGTHHGYFDKNNSKDVIARINHSQADILLVAFGSPIQEQWLIENRDQLHCSTALAVGGLFDFFSGKIPRSPLWLREMGLEWVWRLMQEPKKKFNRYVIGNPVFLFRTYFSNTFSPEEVA